MATDCITQVTFQGDGFAKPVVARFDQPQASTDGGLVLVKALDTHLGVTERVAACLDDGREPGKVQHETVELLQQRIFGLCAGYADCNDAARLVHDPIHKLMVGRDPLTGLGLASQPNLCISSRFPVWPVTRSSVHRRGTTTRRGHDGRSDSAAPHHRSTTGSR